jgi:hypothetical protein
VPEAGGIEPGVGPTGRSLASGPPDAWAVWAAWQGRRDDVGSIATAISEGLDGADCTIELEVKAGRRRIDPDRIETDLPTRHTKVFKRLVIDGTSRDRRVEAEFDNEKDQTPARGVNLRVWSDDLHDAVAIRDSVAVAIDGGRGPLSGDPTMGPPSSEPMEEAFHTAEKRRIERIVSIGCGAILSLVLGAALVHRFADLDPDSAVARFLFFCLCDQKWIPLAVYLLGVGAVLYVIAPVFLPPIEISERSRWQRLWALVLWLVGALGGFTFLFQAAVEAIVNGLP